MKIMHSLKVSQIVLIFCLVCLSLFNAGNAQAQKKLAIDLPMQFRGSMPVIEVDVNGKGKFLFAIDTGAQGMARADSSLVQRLQLQPISEGLAGDGTGRNNRKVDIVQFEIIAIGSLQFRKIQALTRNYNNVPNYLKIDGILGFELFSNHLLTLDFPNKRVRIETGELPKPDGKEILSFENPLGMPLIELSISGMKLVAGIDSGNSESINFPLALANILPHASVPKVVGRGRTVSNEFEIKEVRLKNMLRMGSNEFFEPTITYDESSDEIFLGGKMLHQFSITFDQKNQRVRFIRQKAAN